eukprot:7331220-Heterocapsa_arctica.AAC.1
MPSKEASWRWACSVVKNLLRCSSEIDENGAPSQELEDCTVEIENAQPDGLGEGNEFDVAWYTIRRQARALLEGRGGS